MILVEPLRAQIERLIREIGPAGCQLIVTPSVQSWAHSVGLEEDNPFRAGMAATRSSDGAPAVVLLEEITPDVQAGILGLLELRGFWGEVEGLRDPLVFLEHLVLHEVAHLVLDEPSESECDRWAFARLGARFEAPHP